MLERIRFMKVNQHKRYDYTPRYYDERKERLKAMIALYEKDESDEFDKDSAQYRARIKQRMEQSWSLQTVHSTQSKAANIRLIVILVILIAVTYFIFDYVDMFSSEVYSIDNEAIVP
jgi:hypothetical protein